MSISFLNFILKLLFCFLACHSGWLYSNQLHVKINDPIYEYLDRHATNGILLDYINGTLPLSRRYIADMLILLEEKKDKLSPIDIKFLYEYLADYSYELKDEPYFQLRESETTYHPFLSSLKLKTAMRDLFAYTEIQQDHHLLVYEKGNNFVWLDVGGMIRNEIQNSDAPLIYSYRYSLSTILSENIVAYSEGDLYEMLYNKDSEKMPSEFRGGFSGDVRDGIYGYKKARAFDYSYGYIQHSSNIGNVMLTIEPLIWGNAINPIVLSNNVSPFPAFIWTKTIGNSRFTFLHGSISGVNQDVLLSSDIDYAATYNVGNIEKYLVSHRWEIILSNKFHGTFTEMLVYGARGPELSYLIPTTLLWSVQHNTNNYDNILWFIESEYFPFNGFKFYNSIMIDELTISKMFDDYMNNKWIIQAGTQYVYNILNRPSSLNIEFTASRPWVYTHKFPEVGTYTHNSRCLGFKYGPNSQLLSFNNNWWINTRNQFNISYQRLKFGEETEADINDGYDFGNDPNHNYHLANPKYENSTGWLIGDIEIVQTVRFLWEYKLSNIIDLEVSYSLIKGMNEPVNAVSIQMDIDY